MKGWVAILALLTLVMTASCRDREPLREAAALGRYALVGADEGSAGGQEQHDTIIKAGESEHAEAAVPAMPPPDKIKLIFQPLVLDKLQQGKPSAGWRLNKTISFGEVDGEPTAMDVYVEELNDSYISTMVHGVLHVKGNSYLIRELSHDFIYENSRDAPIYKFGHLFGGQQKFELIGAVEIFANGPGLKLFVVRDVESEELTTFSNWGEPSFLDLDRDGIDEFIIEFLGLHLSWPDLTVVRAEGGKLKRIGSVLDAIKMNEGNAAVLLKREQPPIIEISNLWDESVPVYRYVYKQGALVTKDGA